MCPVCFRRIVCFVTFGLIGFLAGCGGNTIGVTGQVAYDHQPVERGSINFAQTNGGPNFSGAITGGRFKVNMPAGEYLVSINGIRTEKLEKPIALTPGMTPRTTADVEFIPAKYNSRSTLNVVVSREKKVQDFDLEYIEIDQTKPTYLQ